MGTLRAPCIQLRSISFRLRPSPCILPPSLTNLPTCRRGASRQNVATIILKQERGFGDLFDRSNSTVKTYQQKKTTEIISFRLRQCAGPFLPAAEELRPSRDSIPLRRGPLLAC